MVLKRFIAFVIDLFIALIPLVIARFTNRYSLKSFSYLIIFLYSIHTSLFIFITKRNTVGEGLLSICAKSLSNELKNTNRIIVKNLVISFFGVLFIVNFPDIITLVVICLLFFITVTPYRSDSRTNYPVSILDSIFNIYYTECNKITPMIKK